MWTDVTIFIYAMLNHEYILMGGILSFVIGIYERFIHREIASEVFWAIAVLALISASFFAWDEQYRIVQSAIANGARLGFDSPAILPNKRDRTIFIGAFIANYGDSDLEDIRASERAVFIGDKAYIDYGGTPSLAVIYPHQKIPFGFTVTPDHFDQADKVIKQHGPVQFDLDVTYALAGMRYELETNLLYNYNVGGFAIKKETRTKLGPAR